MKLHLVLFVLVGATADYVYGGFGNFSNPIPLIPEADLLTGDLFGQKVAIWDGTCIVSASRRTYIGDALGNEGLVFVFTQNEERQWEDAGVRLESMRSDDGFGTSLSLYQGTAAIGAPNDNSYGTNSGCVHVFYSSTTPFAYSQELYSPNPQDGDFFGFSVAIVSGDTYYYDGGVVVGAYGHNFLYGAHNEKYTADVGCAFVFANKGGTWVVVTTMQPSTASEGAQFGWSVHASSGAIAVGAPGVYSAYLFHLEPVQYDCPHGGVEGDMPDSCLDENGHPLHRHLTNLRGSPSVETGRLGGEDLTYLDSSDRSHVGEKSKERRLQVGPPKYSVWEYVEVLHVQDDEDHKGNGFGSAVAVCNVSSPTLVVAAPSEATSVSGSGVRYGIAGAVYVFSLMPPDDLPSGFNVPVTDPHDEPHHKRRKRKLLDFYDSRLLDIGQVRRRVQAQEPPGADRPGHSNIWYFRSGSYTKDKDGYVWAQSFQVTGNNDNYLYGYCLDIFQDHLVVGVLGGKSVQGRVDIYTFNSSYPLGVPYDSNIDELRFALPVTGGNLYGKAWHRIGTILDLRGGIGDRFGSTTGIHRGVVAVGGSVTGMTDAYHIGTGRNFTLNFVKYL